jgi:single-strand DNA-binding protein
LLNKVQLIGNLAADPEVKATPKGVYIANLRLATNSYAGKDEEGNSKEETEFHNLVIFGKRAEFVGEHLRKGRLLYAEGRLRTRTWTDTAGVKHYKAEIVLDVLELLGPKPLEVAA